ncbi:MAG: Signal peptide peptidase SppA [Parcubacteria group bacterium GW2011_GWA2_40_8]|nr:MAG: Signal peptide peptidase SppA [Parcubacteria group bacterium GW2011_GWB1_40_14]KKR78684.1 MAG: Signal peptide peptidase SppA [Parcubacteria group bacterium GW2011_GWA2_40_8]
MQFAEQIIDGNGRYKIYVIDLLGPIVDEASGGNIMRRGSAQISARYFEIIAQRIRNDQNARGVFLRINSPGGMATASEALYTELNLIRQKIPIFAYADGICASGSYMAALGANKIFAQPSAWIGSIGVIMQKFDLSEGLAKIGIKAETIKSAPLKDAFSQFRSMDEAEREYLQGLLDHTFERFKSLVRANREIASEGEAFSAKVFHAQEAKALGLIDGIGTIYQTKAAFLRYLKERYPNIPLDRYSWVKLLPKQSRFSNLLGALEMKTNLFPEINAVSLMLANPGPWYIWMP